MIIRPGENNTLTQQKIKPLSSSLEAQRLKGCGGVEGIIKPKSPDFLVHSISKGPQEENKLTKPGNKKINLLSGSAQDPLEGYIIM